MVSFLLSKNVNTFKRDSSGKTAKELAEKKGFSEIVRVKINLSFKFDHLKIFKKINLHSEKLELESIQKIQNKKREQGISNFEKI